MLKNKSDYKISNKLYVWLVLCIFLNFILLLAACQATTLTQTLDQQPVTPADQLNFSNDEAPIDSITIVDSNKSNDEITNSGLNPELSTDLAGEALGESIPKHEVTLVFIGDVMMDSFIADYIRDYGVDYPWTDVAEILQQGDLAIANLETSVSTRGATKKPAGFGFRSAPSTLQGLQNSGIDLVTLANNHVKDFGDEAFYDTLEHLTNYQIGYIGAGKTLNEAEELKTFEVNGLKLGFLAYTAIIPWQGWQATADSPGVAPLVIDQYDELLANIKQAKESTDILTVILHWGTEYQDTPNQWQIDLAHQIIDNGADIIVGHHPHILQGIEFYQGKPIFYSIGNFVFLKKDDNAGKTGIFELVIDKNGFKSGVIHPVYIQYTKANLLDSENVLNKEIINNLSKLSEVLGTEVTSTGEFSPLAGRKFNLLSLPGVPIE